MLPESHRTIYKRAQRRRHTPCIFKPMKNNWIKTESEISFQLCHPTQEKETRQVQKTQTREKKAAYEH